MEGASDYTIFCIIQGKKVPFSVKISPNATVDELKKWIKEKKKLKLDHIAADELTLYRIDAAGSTGKERLAAVQAVQEDLPDAFDPVDRLVELYPSSPPEEMIHVLVKYPPESMDMEREASGSGSYRDLTHGKRKSTYSDETDGSQPKRRSPHDSGDKSTAIHSIWSPRQVTVATILDLLLKHHLVQVRGTRGSGKTTLLRLLQAHIEQCRKGAEVYVHSHWPQHQLEGWKDRLREKLPGYPNFSDKERFFLFDEGQTSYWDQGLWLTLRNTIQEFPNPCYAIVFCSYGNESVHEPNLPAPPGFHVKVRLDRVDVDRSKSHGLRLDREEFSQVLGLQKPKLLITDDLSNFVYEFAGGHVGHTLAVVDFLIKEKKDSMLKGERYGLEEFQKDNPSLDNLTTHLVAHRDVSRGLPSRRLEYAQAMKALVLHHQIYIEDESIAPEILSKLEEAYELGFIDSNADEQYCFPSPLTRQIWSWHILPSLNYQLPYSDLLSFVTATVTRFRPLQLTGSDRRVGASDRRPPESQYQEEYYRCVHEITDGNVGISPEYGTAAGTRAGRIDFFIPSNKWGIELTRDGSKLNEHASRFADDGAYGQWLKISNMVDYVLLDFRITQPMRSYRGIRNLYHIVFDSGGTRFEIYDNALTVRAESNLMQRH